MLAPSADRIHRIDQRLRDRLAGSLDYLFTFLSDAGAPPPVDPGAMRARLTEGPVSPWVFGAYALLVQDLSHGRTAEGQAAFAQLDRALGLPAAAGLFAFADPALDADLWNVARTLFDTDPGRPFEPQQPSSAEMAGCMADLEAALAVLEQGEPDFHAELHAVQRVILLARPRSAEPMDRFNGASTFFLWGAALLSIEPRRDVAQMLDVLIHEASHLLLFGLVDGGALSENDPAARYSSPVRRDPRPIDGIFHACFVSTRVYLALSRLLDSPTLPAGLHASIAERAASNAAAARSSLDLLTEELRPTAAGKPIYEALAAYWATADLAHA